jgi:hydrogenase maturation protease
MSAPRIIGVGQPHAGDDGVGVAVVEYLRKRNSLGLELHQARAPTELIELLAHDRQVVIVDALLGVAPGSVRELDAGAIAANPCLLSLHGLGLSEAVELARTLSPERFTPRLHLVGVTIARPKRYQRQLSLEVALAVPRAAALALALCANGIPALAQS